MSDGGICSITSTAPDNNAAPREAALARMALDRAPANEIGLSMLDDLEQFIVALPEGYDTWIGERGVKLSVGQKQRVSIARVLLKDPPIVIFDEATSNIDTETEVKIREALAELTKGRTTFIIAHRLATLHDVDRILVVESGRLVEDGRHDELMRKGGVYAGLYEAQFQV
jgi:ABC-type multidrug transport system fused ATPase/permease subunit